jgi:aspartate aminotransferase
LKVANRVNNINPSFTLQMATKAAEMRSKGIDIINFSVGEPDFNTPKHIRDAAKDALDQGYTKYTAGPGMIEFREAICHKLEKENGISYEPSDILVSNGEKQSLYTACQALFNSGDSVVVFSPYWVSFPEFVKMADSKPVLVNTIPQNNFEPDFSDLESKINPQIKGVIINSPSNPTGGVWSEDAIAKLLKIAKQHDWTVISDECYERLIYGGEFVSAERLNQSHDIGATVVTCMSLSKTYAMTGWRIGYAAGPNKIIKAMSKIQGQTTSCPNAIGQKASVAALLGNPQPVLDMKNKFQERRQVMFDALNALDDVTCDMPGGAFYMFPNFSSYINKKTKEGKILRDTFDLSDYILDTASVVTVAGDGFGAKGYLRLSFATSGKIIKAGIKRIEESLKKLK